MSLLLAAGTGAVAYALSGSAGSYSITGQDGVLAYTPGTPAVAYSLSGECGSYAITGYSALLHYSSGAVVTRGGLPHKHDFTSQLEKKRRLRRQIEEAFAPPVPDEVASEIVERVTNTAPDLEVVELWSAIQVELKRINDDEEAIFLLMQ